MVSVGMRAQDPHVDSTRVSEAPGALGQVLRDRMGVPLWRLNTWTEKSSST